MQINYLIVVAVGNGHSEVFLFTSAPASALAWWCGRVRI